MGLRAGDEQEGDEPEKAKEFSAFQKAREVFHELKKYVPTSAKDVRASSSTLCEVFDELKCDASASAREMWVVFTSSEVFAEYMSSISASAKELWVFSTSPEVLEDDSRRQSRHIFIMILGWTFLLKTAFSFSGFALARTLVLFVMSQVLAYCAKRRPGSLRIDAVFVALMWCWYWDGTWMTKGAMSTKSPLSVGSGLACSFAFTQYCIIACGTHSVMLTAWTVMVWCTCWLSDDHTVRADIMLVGVMALYVSYLFQREEAKKKARQEEKQRLEIKQLRAKEQHGRIEGSLNIVLRQLKSPLLLLVSDLKQCDDATPEEAQQVLGMLNARVSQIWRLFTGLELSVSQAMRDLARSELDSSDRGVPTQTPTAEAVDTLHSAALPQEAASFPEVPFAPPSIEPSETSSRSSRRRSAKRRPIPAIGKVRVVFDMLHPRAEMKEIVVGFSEGREKPGLFDWVKPEDVPKVKDWVQAEANAEYSRHLSGGPLTRDEPVPRTLVFCLPGAGAAVYAEATTAVLRGQVAKPNGAQAERSGEASGSDDTNEAEAGEE
uniref:Transmembrane protein n=1 Tax=Alexandrium monilatum TaxID=311494 RepID=A0A7S4V0D5_9DINO|mmetsp:Transcript_94063/g.294107  ORF Transcript_94063/g.294107 Transcript_94063/m.294107 type:complete len:549 (+) Transcript_94063:48-1694(+)